MSQARELEAPVPTTAIHRLSVAQYEAMARAGILRPEDRVELLEGWLVEKMTKNPPHRIATREVRAALEAVVPSAWYVESQEPIVTSDSEPEPDVAVIRGTSRDYSTENPPARMVGLVIEVADASLLRDRQLKGRIYARAGIASYWIVNLAERIVEVYSRPDSTEAPAGYASRQDFGEDAAVPVLLDGLEVGAVSAARFF
jgi:Uma2 family endonuclease